MQDLHHAKFANLAFQEESKVSAFTTKGDTFDSKLAAENGAAVIGRVKSHHASRSASPPRLKKKDESHIHQITEWVARHQIGISHLAPFSPETSANRNRRIVRQPPCLISTHTPLLPKSAPSHSQIHPTLILQPRN